MFILSDPFRETGEQREEKVQGEIACRPRWTRSPWGRTPEEQEEERADVRAAGGGSETEEGSLESSFQAVLCPKNSPPAGKPLALRPPSSHNRLQVLTHLFRGQEKEDADIGATRRDADAAEGGVESRVQEVLRPKNCPPPDRAHAVRTAAPEHGAVWGNTGSEQRRIPRQQWRNNVQLMDAAELFYSAYLKMDFTVI